MQSSEPEYTNFEMPDVTKYGCGLAGFTMDLQRVWQMQRSDAVRRRIGKRGHYKGGFARAPDGTLYAAPCVHVDGMLYVTRIYRSSDNGLTWDFVTEGPVGKEPTLLALADGVLIMLSEDLQRRANEFRCWRSTDGGKTWTESRMLGLETATTTRAIYQRSDGRLRLFLSNPARDVEGTAVMSQGWAFESVDAGSTWRKLADIDSGGMKHTYAYFCEASLLPLTDDHLLAAVRVGGDFPSRAGAPADMPEDLSHDEAWNRMMRIESLDGGLTWSEPQPMLERGNVHAQMIRLRDGRILATYACYHLPWSVQAAVSDDGGRTFDTDSRMLLSLSVWYCVGWPTSIELDDGSIITGYAKQAYWPDRTVGGGKSDYACEVVRWRLPE